MVSGENDGDPARPQVVFVSGYGTVATAQLLELLLPSPGVLEWLVLTGVAFSVWGVLGARTRTRLMMGLGTMALLLSILKFSVIPVLWVRAGARTFSLPTGLVPMLMVTGQKPIHQSKQARFQIIDAVAMMRPLTKQAKQIIDARHIPAMVRDAFRIAKAERPGPVHFELPEDVGRAHGGLASDD